MPRPPATPLMVFVLSLVPCCAASAQVLAQAPAQAQAPAPKPPAARPQPAAPAAEGLPTADDVRQLYDDRKYKEALQKLSRVLALRGDAAKAYDRHAMLRLKGETHLRLKESAAAAAAFEQAAKEAPDDKARAVDAASALLVKRSKHLTYTPAARKGGANAKAGAGAARGGPIDILDPENRKAAFAALLAEQKEEVAPRLKAAKDARSLPPLAAALEAAGGLRALEIAATGDDAEVKATVQELSARALKMMAEAVDDMAKAVDAIEQSANDLKPVHSPVRSPAPGGGVMLERSYKKQGLKTPDVQDLRRIISDCQKLVPAAKEMAAAVGESGEEFTRVGKDAAAVHDKAKYVLTYDYANDYTRSPRQARDRRLR